MGRRQTEFAAIFTAALAAQVVAYAMDPGISEIAMAVGLFLGCFVIAWMLSRIH